MSVTLCEKPALSALSSASHEEEVRRMEPKLDQYTVLISGNS